MTHPRVRYEIDTWAIRALRFMLTLEGLPTTTYEQKVQNRDPDFGLFMFDGIRPDKAYYVKGTVKMLHKFCALPAPDDSDYMTMITCQIRVLWSAEELVSST